MHFCVVPLPILHSCLSDCHGRETSQLFFPPTREERIYSGSNQNNSSDRLQVLNNILYSIRAWWVFWSGTRGSFLEI
ncbi:hypothetical protein SDJN02_26406 [Cucurbita argyrosperma subsp. argyrosperma]|nr:hypothetical protein SDJN02_26406 [Cucurbita argyrosperma subsp. argyrosperma]